MWPAVQRCVDGSSKGLYGAFGRRDEVLNIGPINSLGSAIKDCRKKMEGFHEVRWVNQPNSWAALIHFVVYLLLAMVVLGVPI